MSYACPGCMVGRLKPTKVSYARRMGNHLVVVPDFDAWRCDNCAFTRYDVTALAKVELLLGRDESEWEDPHSRQHRAAEGPAEQGPRRWSS